MNSKNLSATLSNGHAYIQAGKLEDAAGVYQAILEVEPEQLEALHHLGIVAYQMGRFQEAQSLISKVISLNPQDAMAYSNLGLIFEALEKLDLAASAFRRSIRLKPDNPEAFYNLANIEKKQGKFKEAIVNYDRALQIKPDAEIWNNLGTAYVEDMQTTEAEAAYRKAIEMTPAYAMAHFNLGNALRKQGCIAEALAAYLEAKRLQPNYEDASITFLMTLHYQKTDSDYLYSQALEWAEHFALESLKMSELTFDCDPERRLRIGYVSGDFKSHPVGYFMESVLAMHDHKQVEIFCYANQNILQEITLRLQQSSNHWRNIWGISDQAAAQLICDDKIDILIDLSGYTKGNRLGIFVRKPVAIQASWIGYFDTLGMKTVDYIICDSVVIPESQEQFYTEKPLRLPGCYLCFTPPEVDIAPILRPEGTIFTFGCFNNIAKITPEMVQIYAEILKKLPNSQLYFNRKEWLDMVAQARIIKLFIQQNIAASRLVFEAANGRQEYFESYHKVDIILDTFPYNGGTTTVEALWMGVPVLVLSGEQFLSRLGRSLLSAVELQDWLADSAQEYIAKAVKYALNMNSLNELRTILRQRLLASSLCDAPKFTRNLEAAYRHIWREYCRTQDSK